MIEDKYGGGASSKFILALYQQHIEEHIGHLSQDKDLVANGRDVYKGVITSFDQSTKMHEVTYLDDEVEVLHLESGCWQLVHDEALGTLAANSSIDTFFDDQTNSSSPARKRQKGQSADSLIIHGSTPS